MQAEAERWLHLAAECSLDLAHHLIADRGWKTPSTYRETFEVLERERVLGPELARQMEAWAGLRNILVHMYLEVYHERLWVFLTEQLHQLEEYARALVVAIIDMVMPDLNGRDTFLKMREVNPDVKAVLITGNANVIDKDELLSLGSCAFLEKPFSVTHLAQKLDELGG